MRSGPPTASPRAPTASSPSSSTRSARTPACARSRVHPGGILTPLQRHLEREEMVAAGWIDEDGNPTSRFQFKTPEQGAATSVWAATSPSLDGLGGVYCEDCEIAEPTSDPEAPSGVRAHAVDRDAAARLWTVSAELTGVDAFSVSRAGA